MVTMAMGFGEIWGGKFWALASPFSFSFFLSFSFFRFPPEDAATHACAAAPGPAFAPHMAPGCGGN